MPWRQLQEKLRSVPLPERETRVLEAEGLRGFEMEGTAGIDVRRTFRIGGFVTVTALDSALRVWIRRIGWGGLAVGIVLWTSADIHRTIAQDGPMDRTQVLWLDSTIDGARRR